MRRFRNPRYAPELLERKLSPSTAGVPLTPADVGTVDPSTIYSNTIPPATFPDNSSTVAAITLMTDPEPPDGGGDPTMPPMIPIPDPTGPALLPA